GVVVHRVVDAGYGLDHRQTDDLHGRDLHVGQQVFAGGEIVVQPAFGAPDPVGDPVHGESVEAVGRHDLPGRREHLVAAAFSEGGPPVSTLSTHGHEMTAPFASTGARRPPSTSVPQQVCQAAFLSASNAP